MMHLDIREEYDNIPIFGCGNTPVEKIDEGIKMLAEIISKKVIE